jgi:hypothetical protein
MLFRYVSADTSHSTDLIPIIEFSCGREPLTSEGWPLETMCHDIIVEEGSVFLPDFVLLVNEAFFELGGEIIGGGS